MERLLKIFIFPVLLLLLAPAPARGGSEEDNARIRSAVVKIRNVSQRPNYDSPWKEHNFSSQRGSGVIIAGNRVLTSAHVVSDSKYLELEKEKDGTPYRGVVSFIAHDCDLAIVDVPDKTFFEGTTHLPLSDEIPELGSLVLVYGFPTGGRRITVTRGIVSRIDYTVYTHTARDYHLVLQIDAAINPGNSGGPVLQDGEIAGIAFQVMKASENVGHVIPTTVIDHFLKDIEDGAYDGYPDLGIVYSGLLNEAFRDYKKLPEGKSGVVIDQVNRDSSAWGFVRPGDVLMTIDGNPVRNDSTILIDGTSYYPEEVVERKQVGEKVDCELLRDGEAVRVAVPLKPNREKMARWDQYDHQPRYFVYGGFLFVPLSRGYLKTWNKDWWNRADKRLLYYYNYYYRDRLYLERPEVIVLVRVLPAPFNRYYTGSSDEVIEKVNGIEIDTLNDLVEAVEKNEEKYLIFEFEGDSAPVILNAEQVREGNAEVLKKYGISRDRFLGPEE